MSEYSNIGALTRAWAAIERVKRMDDCETEIHASIETFTRTFKVFKDTQGDESHLLPLGCYCCGQPLDGAQYHSELDCSFFKAIKTMSVSKTPMAVAMKLFSEKLQKLCSISWESTDVVLRELSHSPMTIDGLTNFYLVHGKFPSEIENG